MVFSALMDTRTWQIAGWTMLHTLWIGAVIGFVALICRLLLQRCDCRTRYLFALFCFAILAAAPFAAAHWIWQGWLPGGTTSPTAARHDLDEQAATTLADAPWSAEGSHDQRFDPRLNPKSVERQSLGHDLQGGLPIPNRTLLSETGRTRSELLTAARHSFTSRINSRLQWIAVYLPWTWLILAPLMFMMMMTGIIGAERLRRSSTLLTYDELRIRFPELSDVLDLWPRFSVAVSDQLHSPVLIGIAKPLVLLPATAMTGWPVGQIEMVLLHELAHVPRWDNLINLVQRIVEALLFFHPAVWLLSRWVRQEREHCCDEFVVARTQNPDAYARVLVAMAEPAPATILISRRSALSSPMARHDLVGRLRNILNKEEQSMQISKTTLSVLLVPFLIALACINAQFAFPVQADSVPAKTPELASTRSTASTRSPQTPSVRTKTPVTARKARPFAEAELADPPLESKTNLPEIARNASVTSQSEPAGGEPTKVVQDPQPTDRAFNPLKSLPAAKHKYFTAVLNQDGKKIWLFDRRSKQRSQLHEGDRMRIGSLSLQLLSVDETGAVLKVVDQRFRIELGQSLAEAVAVSPNSSSAPRLDSTRRNRARVGNSGRSTPQNEPRNPLNNLAKSAKQPGLLGQFLQLGQPTAVARPDRIELRNCRIDVLSRAVLASDQVGILAAIDVSPGTFVKKGERLAQLRDEQARLAVSIAERKATSDVAIRIAKETASVADAEYKQALRLRENNVYPESEIRRLQLAVNQANLQIERAQQELAIHKLAYQEARQRLDAFQIRAPIDGTVTKVHKHTGEAVTPGERIVEVVDRTRLRVEAYISGNDRVRVRPGAEVTVSTDRRTPTSNQESFKGKITFVDVEISPVSGRCRVMAEIENRNNLLAAGMIARMTIHVDATSLD